MYVSSTMVLALFAEGTSLFLANIPALTLLYKKLELLALLCLSYSLLFLRCMMWVVLRCKTRDEGARRRCETPADVKDRERSKFVF